MVALLEKGAWLCRGPELTQPAQARLIAYADGDARRPLNTYETWPVCSRADRSLMKAMLERSLGEQLRRYDKGGDQFYDTISALHKSVRGSRSGCRLVLVRRMVDGGVDPRYIVRRLIRMASEDIGLADPRALRMALDAAGNL